MGTRYQDAPDWAHQILEQARRNHFPELKGAYIDILMDTQKRTSQGRTVRGDISRATSRHNFLRGEDYDLVLIIDRLYFENADDGARLADMIHWLCQVDVVTEDEEPAYKIVGPDYPLFEREMQLNPNWREHYQKAASLAAEVHEKRPTVPANDPDAPRLPMKGEGDQDECSIYYNESEDSLREMAAIRGYNLPDGFDTRSDEDRMDYLVELLEKSDQAGEGEPSAA